MLLVILVYVGDSLIFNYSGLTFPKPLVIAVVAVAVLLAMAAVYVFPLQARFENTVKNTLKNAMILAFVNLPKTLLMVGCYVLPLVIAYFSNYALLYFCLAFRRRLTRRHGYIAASLRSWSRRQRKLLMIWTFL